MEFPFKKNISTEEDTKQVANLFSEVLKEGDIVLLNGNLGSGKTFFVKQICRAFGIDDVTSPTFSIVNEYYGDIKIYHFDFYRINKLVELEDIGFDEYIDDVESIIFIEWADMFPEILPTKKIYNVNFIKAENEERVISIKFVI